MNLKADLDQYLSQNKRTPGGSVLEKLKLPTFKLNAPSFGLSSDTERLLEGEVDEGTQKSWLASALPTLSKKQRILGFGGSVFMGLLCFILASLYFPVLLLQSRKFALLFTLGSIFTLSSFSFLYGPWAHIQTLFASKERLPFTIIYFLTLFGTLFAALGLQSTGLTIICAVGQVGALSWFIVSYIPGGQTGLKFMSRIFSSFCTKTSGNRLPI